MAIRRVPAYDHDLRTIVLETLREFDLAVRHKSVVLKPNFVTADSGSFVNTHPALIAAAKEAFLSLGASQVLVADGPAIERDTEAVLESMRAGDYLGRLGRTFVDLNVDDVERVALRTRASKLSELYLPKTVLRSDFVVSMPKLKTHHWTGVSLSLKNMFGIVPGGVYGWPKNVLHWAGLEGAILDLNTTLKPDFAIVDGVVGMQGNGPIQGSLKRCGVVVMGNDPVAVDATCARVMGLQPEKIGHLARASYLLGNLKQEKITQIGESIAAVATRFEVLECFRKLQAPA